MVVQTPLPASAYGRAVRLPFFPDAVMQRRQPCPCTCQRSTFNLTRRAPPRTGVRRAQSTALVTRALLRRARPCSRSMTSAVCTNTYCICTTRATGSRRSRCDRAQKQRPSMRSVLAQCEGTGALTKAPFGSPACLSAYMHGEKPVPSSVLSAQPVPPNVQRSDALSAPALHPLSQQGKVQVVFRSMSRQRRGALALSARFAQGAGIPAALATL